MKYTIACGNAFDGLSLEGLFDSPEEAVEWADENRAGSEWNLVNINTEPN